ncbi:Amino acid/polyamine transporter I [Trypanosoma melophagium]|uniref:Amino acid/polyamine transporter I n=1 Tax=Trypanosoma melophagium TaxID=715481 RepID=UPI00351A454F|nr:Amino acid/polyamine transporter I [Trypanosoma melophagium]
MNTPVESNFPTLVRRRQHVEPLFHPTLRRTKEVIRRPDWVRRAGEAVAHRGSIGVLGLFGIMFASCLGGGYGFEDTVGAAGPLLTLIFGLVVPWIWCFPTALAVAELSTSVPSNSGLLMWVNAAFPASVSFMCIISTIMVTFVGNATFPNLTAEYVMEVTTLSKGGEIGVKVGVVVLCCILNCSGVEIVGSVSIVVCFIAILPFLILSFQYLFTHGLDGKAITHVDAKSIDWGLFLGMISWNYANIENAGSVVEEVANPKRTVPLMMIPLLLSSYFAYLLPMLTGVSALGPNQEWSKWQAGYWPEVARVISGSWLKYYLFGGSIVSGLGFTLTSMCCTSRVLAGMGTMQIFPKKISRIIGYYHPTIGTPIPAIVLNATVTLVFSVSMDFGDVVVLCQCLYCLRMVLMYAALIKLRIDHPNLPRPFALPFGTVGATIFVLPATIFCLIATVACATFSLAIGMSLVGFLVGGSVFSYLYCRFFAPNGFQGVIVQCEMTDEDDDENARGDGEQGNGGNTAQVDEGVFYDDEYNGKEGNLFVGILPVGGASVDGENEGEMQGELNNNSFNEREYCEPFGRSGPMAFSNGSMHDVHVVPCDNSGFVGSDNVADEKPPPNRS